ncbi:MAG: cbb3-type cytochrome c oxidase subunit I [Thermoflexus sp.]|jgi:cytochrome c oxidase subunit 1|nr:cbb3-type cytochrome c oxidase subunit I [Thermoflexus sp.]MDT7948677.1 cbb3-type cytochrome c oxidase subunit I [Thermoflexus sp.]
MRAFYPILRGLLLGVIGYLLGAGAFALATGQGLTSEPALVLGYALGLIGWLLGVGLWEVWAREWLGWPAHREEPEGWARYFRFTTDHKVIGVQYLVTFIGVLLLGGLLAMLMRLELMQPGLQVFANRDQYNTVMSLHGIFMIAVAVATIIGGLGNYLVPLMIGARDMAFPRLNALSYWLVPPAALALLSSPLVGGFDSGWTAYPPLSVTNATGQVLFNLAFITVGLSSILGGLNFLTTIIFLRAPGMTWGRLPIFVWSIFLTSILSLIATQFVATALLMVLFDRVVGTGFFNPAKGGDPLFYQHVFWFYSHPAVYIMIVPAFGVILEILPHFARKPLFAYRWAVGGFMGIVGLSFLVWAHHMFTSGMPYFLHLPFMATTELISVPTGLVFLAALGTIWQGRLWLRTPMLIAMAFLWNFLIGGITGIFLADVPTDFHFQDTYFVVGHFHYTIMGGMIFALIAGIYYWFPKITGRMYDERLGRIHALWLFLAYNSTFLPMFWAGLYGMNRRIADYPPYLAGVNIWVSISAFVLGASFAFFVVHLAYAWARGPRAVANPWQARTLEWQTSSPPPVENFPVLPRVVGDPYGYGVPGSAHAWVGASSGE